MNAAEIDKAWSVFQQLMRNHPLWPSTFSPCGCGRGMARGIGDCKHCLHEELAEIVGPVLAQRADKALAEVSEVWSLIQEVAGKRVGP